MKRTGRQKDIVTPEKKQEQRELLRLFSANIRKILKNTDLLADDLQEILVGVEGKTSYVIHRIADIRR